jgi:hypothetical protein
MSDKVIRISEERGPPEGSFEVDAVEVLLSSIRAYRGSVGRDPEMAIFTLMDSGPEAVIKTGHLRTGGASSRLFYAFAAARLAQEAVEP